MSNWKELLRGHVVDVENHFDTLRRRFKKRIGWADPIHIVPYRGFGNDEVFYLKGRVLENEHVESATDDDSIWTNLLNMYKRFESDEIPGARVRARIGSVEQEAVADTEGFFDFELRLPEPPPSGKRWHEVELELLEPRPADAALRATGSVLVPSPKAQFGVISDVDDTVLRTGATDRLRMTRITVLSNARTRLPFEGVAAFYSALEKGPDGVSSNPLFYVSSGPWNLYDLLVDFLDFHHIPAGPILLRDLGLDREQKKHHHRKHKLSKIRPLLEAYPRLPFVLIGDSGQEDASIYGELVQEFPGRIQAVYIRNVSAKSSRVEELEDLARQVAEQQGVPMLLADDTVAAARHAAEHGWIRQEALAEVEAQKQADRDEKGLLERLLGGEGPLSGGTAQSSG